MLSTGFEDGEVEAGTHVMFDCHGTIDLYCWDGGKTWVVDGEPEGDARRWAKATSAVAETLIAAMKPGARITELQALARAHLPQGRRARSRTAPSSSSTASGCRTWSSS